jgi:hypothetical protein
MPMELESLYACFVPDGIISRAAAAHVLLSMSFTPSCAFLV